MQIESSGACIACPLVTILFLFVCVCGGGGLGIGSGNENWVGDVNNHSIFKGVRGHNYSIIKGHRIINLSLTV